MAVAELRYGGPESVNSRLLGDVQNLSAPSPNMELFSAISKAA